MANKVNLYIASAISLWVSMLIVSAAHASLVVSFDYSGSATAGANSANLNDFPSGGPTETLAGPADIDTGLPRQFATLIGCLLYTSPSPRDS